MGLKACFVFIINFNTEDKFSLFIQHWNIFTSKVDKSYENLCEISEKSVFFANVSN